jgi:quinol monooxygenase YgiN
MQRTVFSQEQNMKLFLIKYQFKNGTPEAWHKQVGEFIAQLDSDPDLKGKLSYRVMREKEGPGYYHLATPADEQTVKVLQQKDFFKRYSEATKTVGGGEVQVLPLEVVAETVYRA